MNISRVRKLTGLSAKSIRFYESRGLIKINRLDNGYRDYSENDVRLLTSIRDMRRVGIPVSDIRLWRDGVVSAEELFRKRLRTLEDDDKYSLECSLNVFSLPPVR